MGEASGSAHHAEKYRKGHLVKLEVTHQTDPKEWEVLIERFSGSIFLRPECLAVHDEDYLPCYFKFYDDCQMVTGIAFGALFHSRRKLVGRFIRSLYFPTLPVTDQKTQSHLGRMIEKITEYGHQEKVVSITVGSFDSGAAYDGFEPLGFQTRSRCEFLLDLQGSEAQIWDRLDAHHRRYIKYAEKKGLTLREDPSSEGLQCLMELQENATKRIQERGGNDRLNSRQQYQSIQKAILDKGLGSVFLAVKDGKAHSALLVAIFRQRAYLIFSGTSPEGYQLRSSVFLFWNAAMALKKRGIAEWNLGGTPWEAQAETSDSHGLFTFKERFGTKKVLCYTGEMKRVNKLRSTAIDFTRVLVAWKS